MKRCNKCLKLLAVVNYYKDYEYCKECVRKQNRTWDNNNRDKLKARSMARWKKNKNNPEYLKKVHAAEKKHKDKDRVAWNKKHITWYHIDQLSKKTGISKEILPSELLCLKLALVEAKNIIKKEREYAKNRT